MAAHATWASNYTRARLRAQLPRIRSDTTDTAGTDASWAEIKTAQAPHVVPNNEQRALRRISPTLLGSRWAPWIERAAARAPTPALRAGLCSLTSAQGTLGARQRVAVWWRAVLCGMQFCAVSSPRIMDATAPFG